MLEKVIFRENNDIVNVGECNDTVIIRQKNDIVNAEENIGIVDVGKKNDTVSIVENENSATDVREENNKRILWKIMYH